jgi:hypothetical protein
MEMRRAGHLSRLTGAYYPDGVGDADERKGVVHGLSRRGGAHGTTSSMDLHQCWIFLKHLIYKNICTHKDEKLWGMKQKKGEENLEK